MKIGLVSIPSRDNGNPYQKLFYRELEKYGFEIHDHINFRLLDIIKNRRIIDVLHFHWYPACEDNILKGYRKTFFFFIKLVLVRLMGIKIIWTAHNLLPHDSKYPKLQYLQRWILVHMCNLIIVHFEQAKDMLNRIFKIPKSKMLCVHHGLYEGYYPNSATFESAREALNVPVSSTVFLYFGKMRRYKNIESLIKGFQDTVIKGKDIILLLVGKPEEENYQRELLMLTESYKTIRVYFGFVPAEDVQLYFNAADCCILPYKNIFTSGAAMLALTFRKPIIMKKCAFSNEYLASENSLLLDDWSADAITTALENFCRNKTSLKVTEEFVSRYKWENIFSEAIVSKCQDLVCKK